MLPRWPLSPIAASPQGSPQQSGRSHQHNQRALLTVFIAGHSSPQATRASAACVAAMTRSLGLFEAAVVLAPGAAEALLREEGRAEEEGSLVVLEEDAVAKALGGDAEGVLVVVDGAAAGTWAGALHEQKKRTTSRQGLSGRRTVATSSTVDAESLSRLGTAVLQEAGPVAGNFSGYLSLPSGEIVAARPPQAIVSIEEFMDQVKSVLWDDITGTQKTRIVPHASVRTVVTFGSVGEDDSDSPWDDSQPTNTERRFKTNERSRLAARVLLGRNSPSNDQKISQQKVADDGEPHRSVNVVGGENNLGNDNCAFTQHAPRKHRKTRARPEMSPIERLELTWWSKWKVYRRFPWKLFIHLMLAVLTSVQIFVFSDVNVPYRNNVRSMLENTLVPIDIQGRENVGYHSWPIYRIEESLHAIETCVTAYHNFDQESISKWSYLYNYADLFGEKFEDFYWLVMHVTEFEDGARVFTDPIPNLATKTRSYNLTDSFSAGLGPFVTVKDYNQNETAREAMKDYFAILTEVRITFGLTGQDFAENIRVFYGWQIAFMINFLPSGGRAELSLQADADTAPFVPGESFGQALAFYAKQWMWVELVIIIFAIVSLILTARSVIHAMRDASHTTEFSFSLQTGFRLQERVNKNAGWFATRIWRPLSFVRGWYLVALIAAVFNIMSAAFSIGAHLGAGRASLLVTLVTGFGCAMAWFNLLRYFESFSTYYTLILALQRGMPGVAKLLVSSLPILLGYTMFGLVVFGDRSDNFNTFDHSFAALFSTINGDSLYARFIEIADQPNYTVIARLYEYSFVCVACYAVVNIFIAIIQEAYNSARKEEVRDAVATELARIRQHEQQLRNIAEGSDISDNGSDNGDSESSMFRNYDTEADVRLELQRVPGRHSVLRADSSESVVRPVSGRIHIAPDVALHGSSFSRDEFEDRDSVLLSPPRNRGNSSSTTEVVTVPVYLLQETLRALRVSQREVESLSAGVQETRDRIEALGSALEQNILSQTRGTRGSSMR